VLAHLGELGDEIDDLVLEDRRADLGLGVAFSRLD
jgi:hypothetical protein